MRATALHLAEHHRSDGEAPASCGFVVHHWVGDGEATDSKTPVNSPLWGDLGEWEEREAAARVAALAATASEPSTSNQGAAQTSAGPDDVRPTLQDLDVVQAVCTVHGSPWSGGPYSRHLV